MDKGTDWKKAKTRWYINSYVAEDSYITKSSSFWLTNVEAAHGLHTAIGKLIHDHPDSRCVSDDCSKCERKGWHEQSSKRAKRIR